MATKFEVIPLGEISSKSSGPTAFPILRDVRNTVVAAQQNVLDGPGTIRSMTLDGTEDTANTATKTYVKLYDIITGAWTVTSAPDIVIPVKDPVVAGAAASVIGKQVVHIVGGVSFAKGISVLATGTPGDIATDPPGATASFNIHMGID